MKKELAAMPTLFLLKKRSKMMVFTFVFNNFASLKKYLKF